MYEELDNVLPLSEGVHRALAPPSMWSALEGGSGESDTVILGLTGATVDGRVVLSFALEEGPGGPTYLGEPGSTGFDSAALRAFLESNERTKEASLRDVLVAWNRDASGPRSRYPVSKGLQADWKEFLPSYLTGGASPVPPAGSQAWWDAAPPRCRSMSDAPDAVKQSLVRAEVWVRVPDSWTRVEDAVICLRTPLASLGCAEFDADVRTGLLLFDEAFAVPDSPIDVQIARSGTQGPSWIDRTTLGSIDFDVITETNVVLVELTSDAVPTSYEAFGETPDRDYVESIESISPSFRP
jgi:hypothetical protein